jgi:hypothetical protein
MGVFDMFKFVREEEANILVWLVGIIQGKTTMDCFERLIAVKESDNIYFEPTDDKKYDW